MPGLKLVTKNIELLPGEGVLFFPYTVHRGLQLPQYVPTRRALYLSIVFVGHGPGMRKTFALPRKIAGHSDKTIGSFTLTSATGLGSKPVPITVADVEAYDTVPLPSPLSLASVSSCPPSSAPVSVMRHSRSAPKQRVPVERGGLHSRTAHTSAPQTCDAPIMVTALPKGAISFTVEVPRDIRSSSNKRPTELDRLNCGPRVYGKSGCQ